MHLNKRLLFLSLSAGISLSLQACASNPHQLKIARIECNQQYISWESSIKKHYLCIQEKSPFGAYQAKGLKEKTKPMLQHSGGIFADEIDFIHRAPEEDQPWLMMALGSKALADGNIDLAYELFEINARVVETIYGGTPQAKKARAAFHQEAEKRFIGETYERAMIFHYLGVLDLMSGNYQNARAAFRASSLQDALAHDENHRQDFASSLWLRGWAEHCANSPSAKENFNKASTHAFIPPPNKADNLLIIIEIGLGPFKIARGQHGEQLAYIRQKPTPIQSAFQPARLGLFQANDLFFQATTRGDRKFDKYLKAQRESKDMAKHLGEASVITGAALLNEASKIEDGAAALAIAAIGVGAIMVGGVSYAVSSAINPTADMRTWRQLPHAIYLGSFATDKRARDISLLRSQDPQLSFLINWIEDNHDQLSVIFKNSGKCQILWVRDKSAHP